MRDYSAHGELPGLIVPQFVSFFLHLLVVVDEGHLFECSLIRLGNGDVALVVDSGIFEVNHLPFL